MAIRSRCQGRSLGERRGSLTADLLADVGRVKPGEELAEQFVELLLSLGGQIRPHQRWVENRCRWCVQARGGVVCRRVSDMQLLHRDWRVVARTRQPVRATPSRRW